MKFAYYLLLLTRVRLSGCDLHGRRWLSSRQSIIAATASRVGATPHDADWPPTTNASRLHAWVFSLSFLAALMQCHPTTLQFASHRPSHAFRGTSRRVRSSVFVPTRAPRLGPVAVLASSSASVRRFRLGRGRSSAGRATLVSASLRAIVERCSTRLQSTPCNISYVFPCFLVLSGSLARGCFRPTPLRLWPSGPIPLRRLPYCVPVPPKRRRKLSRSLLHERNSSRPRHCSAWFVLWILLPVLRNISSGTPSIQIY